MEIDFSQYYPVWVDEFKRCSKWIDDALAYTNHEFTLQDIADGIHRKQYTMWTCETAAMITQFVNSNGRYTLHIFLAGGDIAGVEQLVKQCEEWAVSVGCVAITLSGREGWKKSFLKPMGFKDVSINMTKVLE